MPNHGHDIAWTDLHGAPDNAFCRRCGKLGEVMVHSMQRYVTDVPVKAEPLIMARIYKNAEPVYDANGKLIPWEPKK